MNFWDILEINPTDNASIVKKAYAKKLKLYHPEDDPEGYQKLREAYDSALKYIRNNKNKPPINSSKKERNEDSEVILEDDNLYNIKKTPPHINIFEEFTERAPSYEESVEEFINNAQILYNNFFSRIDIENWITLLKSEAMWYIGDKTLLSNKMIEFLIEKHYFPASVWRLLEDNFNWKEQKEYLYNKYPEKFVNYLFKQINDNNGLRYCYFEGGQVFDYETFFKYREEAFEELSNNNFGYAEECINNANKIYDKDPDVLLMMGICYLHSKDADKALQVFENLVQRHSEDLHARFYRAKVLYDKGQIADALDDCRYIDTYKFSSWDFILLFAKCCFKVEEFHKAKELILPLLNVDHLCVEAKDLLKQVNLQLARKLREELKKNKKNKETKFKLDKLDKELVTLDSKEIIKKLSNNMIKRVLICLLILFVQVTITYSAMKIMGIKDNTSLKNIVQVVTTGKKSSQVESSEDINKLPPEISNVQGKLTNAGFLDLHRIPMRGEKGNINRVYLTLKEAEEKDLFKDATGYVCIGTLGDKKIIAIVGYEEAKQAYETKTIDFKGTIHYMPEDDLIDEVMERCMTKNFNNEFITNIFIDTEVKLSIFMEVVLSIDTLLLCVQFVIIAQGLVVGYMLVKANRKV